MHCSLIMHGFHNGKWLILCSKLLLQSGYVYVHEMAEKIVEGIVDKFCLFFSSMKAVRLQLGRGVAK